MKKLIEAINSLERPPWYGTTMPPGYENICVFADGRLMVTNDGKQPMVHSGKPGGAWIFMEDRDSDEPF